MKKYFLKTLSILMIFSLIIVSSINFASASTLLDSSKKVSLYLQCSKPGYTFTIYKVASLDSTETSPYKTEYNSLVPEITDGILSGKTSDIISALDMIDSIPSTAPVVGTFTSSAVLTSKTISNLSQGMYYVKATNYPAGVKAVRNSVAALPYYNNGWIYSIDKINLAEKVVEDVPVTHKEITNSTKGNVNYTDVSLGDTVNFEIRSTTAGSSSMKLGSYLVTDDMSAGLTLNKNSFNVSLLTKDGTKITDLDNTEYEVNVTSEADGKNTLFNVALTNSYLQAEEFYASDVYYTSVTYSAVLNKHAVVGVEGNPNTEGKLEYSNKNGVTSSVDGNTVYVYTYSINTNKLNPQGDKLAGAEFSLYKTEENAKMQKNEIASGISDANGKVFYYNAKGEEIKLQSGTYYIIETKAPENYNIYGKVIEISIDVTYGNTLTNGTYVTNSPKNGYAVIDVINTAFTAPETGGIGNMIFYIAGTCFLVGSAVLFFISHKYKKAKR